MVLFVFAATVMNNTAPWAPISVVFFDIKFKRWADFCSSHFEDVTVTGIKFN